MSNYVIPVLLLVDGFACILMAVFAHALGLDPTDVWGRRRVFLFVLGWILIAISLFTLFFKRKNIFEPLQKSDTVKTFFLLGHVWGIILAIYIWFITFGNFTTWTHTSHYYTLLADAFQRGQLHVNLNPGPSLLEASDPYDPNGRAPFQDDIWDMSFYEGKLYYYWGPVPALAILPVQKLLDVKVLDNYLVFIFFAGLLIFNSLIILKLWRTFFPGIPAWTVFLCILLIGLILPIVWETAVPNVYGAAVGAGQFFLIGGMYFALSVFDKNEPFDKVKLFLAGLFWACSVGSRAINALSVIFMAVVLSYWIAQSLSKPFHWKKYIRVASVLFIPLIAGAVAIGWYNWARFDSILEFGLRYQITTYNLNERMDEVFQLKYFFSNLYVYIFQPFGLISDFPFIKPTVLPGHFIQIGSETGQLYYAGRMAGILFSAPFLTLGLIPLFSKPDLANETDGSSRTRAYSYVVLLLAGSSLIGFLTILFYFNAQTRFLVDIISQLTLLAILGYWGLVFKWQQSNSAKAKFLMTLAVILLILTLIAGLLLSITGETSRMETLNPLLFEKMKNIFRFP